MHAFLRFPDFKKRALTLSYDDGVIFDRRLMQILDAKGIKCTFNLNSGTYGNSRRFTREEAIALYKDSPHEVAVHGVHHVTLTEVDSATAVRDILLDRLDHEATYGKIVRGMAYANGRYDNNVVELLRQCGIVYARTVIGTERFDIPTDWLRLRATCHHNNPRLMELADAFLGDINSKYAWRDSPRLFYLWGHSYEFNDQNNWEVIEAFAEKVGGRDDVWYATNIEVYDYVKAYESLVYSADTTLVHNPSATDVWLSYYDKQVFVPAGKTAQIPKIWD